MIAHKGRPDRASLAVAAAGIALTAVILAPVLFERGFVLVYDMVFVPRQPLLPASVGLGPALPRAVPADAVVALISTVLPGDVLQKLVLAGSLLAGALGAGRLVPTERTAIRVLAAVVYTWNAYVAERLFIGHWTVLVAYGALPWIVLAGLGVRRSDPRAWPRLVLCMLPAALGPTGGLLAAGAAVAAVGRRGALAAGGVAVLLAAPWWVPSVLRPGVAVSDPGAVAAFAARGESWGGAVLSVLGLGGIWNADVVPASRDSPVVPVVSLLVAALALAGCLELARRWGPRPARAVLVLAALGVLIGVAGSVPPLDAGLRWAVQHVPGAGLVRDGQRWVAWWALLVALGLPLAVERIVRWLAARVADPLASGAALVAALLLPIAALPDLAWGGFGRLEPVRYPDDWAAVAEIVAAEPDRGDVVVVPFMTYRAFAWNDGRTQLDPAPRLVPETTVVDDALPVGPTVVAGEDPRVAEARTALAAGAPLTELGAGWLLVEHGTPGDLPPGLADLTPRYLGDWVSLYEIDGGATPEAAPGAQPDAEPDAQPDGEAGAPAVPVLMADAAAVLLTGVAVLWLLLPVSRVGAPEQR